MGVIAAIGAVIGVAGQRSQAKKAAAASASANERARKQQETATRNRRRQAARRLQLQRANMRAQAEGRGLAGGSALAGARGSLSSQLGTQLGFSTQMSGLSNEISNFQQQQIFAQNRADMFGGLTKLSMNLGAQEGFGTIGKTIRGT